MHELIKEVLSLKIESLYKESEYKYNNNPIPRVTQILHKMIEEDEYIKWANRLGFQQKDYDETLNYYADIGSKVHNAIECYINKKNINSDTPYNPFKSFLDYYTNISNHKSVKVIGQEKSLICPYYGGTYDLLLDINNKFHLIDFKTSSTISFKYYLQLAAYNYILKESSKIDYVDIVQLSRNKVEYKVYTLNLNNKQHKDYFDMCEKTFLSLVYSYYHILYTESWFKNEFS